MILYRYIAAVSRRGEQILSGWGKKPNLAGPMKSTLLQDSLQSINSVLASLSNRREASNVKPV